MLYDAIVVGAGPAGSTAARLMAERGLRVALLEKARWPRPKVCGGGVTGRACRMLGVDIGPATEDVVTRVVVSHRGRRRFQYDYGAPLVAMVTRASLDALLVEHACKAGVLFFPGLPVTAVSLHSDRVEVAAGDGRRLAALYLVGADGVFSAVARACGLARGKRLALALEWELVPEDGPARWRGVMALDSAAVPCGYGWVFPKRDRLSVGVGGLTRDARALRAALERMLRGYGLAGAVLKQRAYWLSSGGPPLAIQRGRVLLAGDAAGLVDPFLGEGIYYAAWSGRLAAEAVAEALAAGGEPAYERRVAAALTPDLRRAERLMHWFYRWHGPLLGALTRWPALMRPLLDVVAGRITYAELPAAARDAARRLPGRWLARGGGGGPLP